MLCAPIELATNLHKHQAPQPLWVAVQQTLICLQLELDALENVHVIHAQKHKLWCQIAWGPHSAVQHAVQTDCCAVQTGQKDGLVPCIACIPAQAHLVLELAEQLTASPAKLTPLKPIQQPLWVDT